jgi:putative ABC transport system permease protein
MERLWQDVRYGVRMFLRGRNFTVLAVAALALGIGTNAAVYSVAIAFLKKPISFPHLDRLVMVLNMAPQQTVGWNEISPADYLDYKAQSRSFEKMAGSEYDDFNIAGTGDPERLVGVHVSANYFQTLEASPFLGRTFLPEEEVPGRDKEVILSYGLWQRRFASDPNIIGKTTRINGASYLITGVMGKEFGFPTVAQLWVPLALEAKERTVRNSHYLEIVARLKPGVSIAAARAEMWTIEGRLQQQFPENEKGWGMKVMPLDVFVAGELADQYSVMLLGAAVFVLLIACANVANLQFARSASRHKEIAVRRAMGASRLRIVRQLLTESVLVAGVAAVIGLLLGQWGIGLVRSYMPPEVEKYLPMWKHVRLETDVLFYTIGIAFLAGIISGLAPAFQSAKSDVNEELKEGGRSSTAGRARHRLRSIFVVAEVALSLILLVGAGLMAKGVRALLSVNQNIDPKTIVTAMISLPDSKYKTPQQQAAFYEQMLQQFDTISGVKSAAVATKLPFGDSGQSDTFSIEGRAFQPGDYHIASFESINPEYFRMMKIPLLKGRELSDQDGDKAPPVAVVSESFVRRYFPGENPLGKHIKEEEHDSKPPWLTIVGIVGDIKYNPWEREEDPPLYVSYRQVPWSFSGIALRTDGDPMKFGAAVRSRIASVDPDQPIFDVLPLDKVISNEILGLSYVAVMLTVMGVMALVLASIGVYGVMAFSVTERTHEIGVRMALGAQQRDVLRLVLTRGVLLTLLGLVIGLPVAFMLARLLASVIFGVSATDLVIFCGGTAVMTAIALLACYVPARRAMQVDPMVALRYE